MKREILNFKLHRAIGGCCPGHDDWPDQTYRNPRSKRARSKQTRMEHRVVRANVRQQLIREVQEVL